MSTDEFDRLREFRADVPGPSEQDVATARQALADAIAGKRPEEASVNRALGGPMLRKPRRRLGLVGVAIAASVAVGVTAIVVAISERDDTSDRYQEPGTLSGLASNLQATYAAEFEHLADQGETLRDVVASSTVAGTGRIVDVRLAYTEPPVQGGVEHMLLVIKPNELASGAEVLGTSGHVLIDAFPPQVNHEGVRPGWDQLRNNALNSQGQVAFMLTPTPPSWYEKSPDPYEGRATDDPIFVPTHPSAFFGFDETSGVAFPLMSDENLQEVSGNIETMKSLGADVDRFAVADESVTFGTP